MALGLYHPDDGAWKSMAWEKLIWSSWFQIDVLPTCLDIPSPIFASLKSIVLTASKVVLHYKSDLSIPLLFPFIDSPYSRNKAWDPIPVLWGSVYFNACLLNNTFAQTTLPRIFTHMPNSQNFTLYWCLSQTHLLHWFSLIAPVVNKISFLLCCIGLL